MTEYVKSRKEPVHRPFIFLRPAKHLRAKFRAMCLALLKILFVGGVT